MRHNKKVAFSEWAVFETLESSLNRVIKMKICVSFKKTFTCFHMSFVMMC